MNARSSVKSRSSEPTPTERTAPSVTLTDVAWEQIRDDVLAGRLEPGSRLTIESLRERYSIGASPIREALWRLSAEGLVKSSNHRGFEVMEVFRDELVDVIRLRILLEQQALEEAIAAGTDAWEAEILSCFHRLSKYRQTDGRDWDLWHRRFHDALVATCGAPVLQQLRGQLFDMSRRYRNLTRSISSRDDLDEHRALMEACFARDAVLAKRLIAEHFELTGKLVLNMFDAQQDQGKA